MQDIIEKLYIAKYNIVTYMNIFNVLYRGKRWNIIAIISIVITGQMLVKMKRFLALVT